MKKKPLSRSERIRSISLKMAMVQLQNTPFRLRVNVNNVERVGWYKVVKYGYENRMSFWYK